MQLESKRSMLNARAKRRITSALITNMTKHCNATCSKAVLEFLNIQKDTKKDTPCIYRVPHTEDTVRGQHEGRLSFKSVFSCTSLRDKGTNQHKWPKQGHWRCIDHKGMPSAIHRPQKDMIGQIFSWSANNFADRPKMAISGQFWHFASGV